MRKVKLFITTVLLIASLSMTARAGEWKQDDAGWWYQDDIENFKESGRD